MDEPSHTWGTSDHVDTGKFKSTVQLSVVEAAMLPAASVAHSLAVTVVPEALGPMLKAAADDAFADTCI